MPYIEQSIREKLIDDITGLATSIQIEANSDTRAGLMNFAITKLIGEVYGIKPDRSQLRYHEWSEIIGFLECAKLELYRKCIAPYEDVKEKENGPVLTYDEFFYTDDNAWFLSNGDIVPKICPYCQCEVDEPKSYQDYLNAHNTCNND